MRRLDFATSIAAATFAVAVAAAPMRAATSFDSYVDLQLVLAVDISGSMDQVEQQLQRDGYVRAFRDPEVIKAITSGPYGRIAVTYVRWAGAFIQEATVPWTVIGSTQDAQAFAAAINQAPLHTAPRTSISGALTFSLGAFTRSGLESDRRTIDISGDGSNNDGPTVRSIREKVLASGTVINGLPILLDPSGVAGNFATLDAYYRDCVSGGPGSFVIPIKSLQDFAPAIRRKLILEIAATPLPDSGVVPVSSILPSPPVNCALLDGPFGGNFFP